MDIHYERKRDAKLAALERIALRFRDLKTG